jgi:hypothetical protein
MPELQEIGKRESLQAIAMLALEFSCLLMEVGSSARHVDEMTTKVAFGLGAERVDVRVDDRRWTGWNYPDVQGRPLERKRDPASRVDCRRSADRAGRLQCGRCAYGTDAAHAIFSTSPRFVCSRRGGRRMCRFRPLAGS